MSISALNMMSSSLPGANSLYWNRLSSIKVPAYARVTKVLTAYGNVSVSTSSPKFGTGSAAFDGTGDYISLNNFTDATSRSAGDTTVEAWVNFAQQPSSQTGGGGAYMVLYFSGLSTGTVITGTEPYVLIQNTPTTNYPKLSIGVKTGPTSSAYFDFASYTGSSITLNTWYHVALVKKTGIWKAYWNGNDMGALTGTNPGASGYMFYDSGTVGMNIGGWPQMGRGYWNGKIDEIRFSANARYTGPFTPSTVAFANDENTLFLMHADGTNGSTVFTDSAS